MANRIATLVCVIGMCINMVTDNLVGVIGIGFFSNPEYDGSIK